MKKFFLFIIPLTLVFHLFPIVPGYFGARSLSLGYSTTGYNLDINSIFINPALLSYVNSPISGYQYQHSYLDYKDFLGNLNDILNYDLIDFENIDFNKKELLFSKLKNLFNSKSGIYGFRSNIPGFVTRNYGISFSVIDTAIMNARDNDIFNKKVEEISNEDIASLKMNFKGLRYKKFSFAYSLFIVKNVSIGVGFHYLNGKITGFNSSIVDEVFISDSISRDYLEYAWKKAEDKFSKIITDLGISVDVGKNFRIGVIAKNLGNPIINGSETRIVLETRITAGIAFRPDPQFGIYFDMDIKKTDLLLNGEMMQPFSFGIEKGFFNNKFFLRAGLLNDLTEKYFIGSKSNILYGIGIGFNMNKFFVDFAIGIDNVGTINNLAISGFFVLK